MNTNLIYVDTSTGKALATLSATRNGRATSQTTVTCDDCHWALPIGLHADEGTPERPGNADFVDWATPQIGDHIDSTGHEVVVTLDTFSTGEQTVTRMSGRRVPS